MTTAKSFAQLRVMASNWEPRRPAPEAPSAVEPPKPQRARIGKKIGQPLVWNDGDDHELKSGPIYACDKPIGYQSQQTNSTAMIVRHPGIFHVAFWSPEDWEAMRPEYRPDCATFNEYIGAYVALILCFDARKFDSPGGCFGDGEDD